MSHRIMQLSNDSAMTYPLQVIVSPDDAQLVAAIVAGFSSQLTAALRAHLANNSTKKSLTLSYYPDGLLEQLCAINTCQRLKSVTSAIARRGSATA